MKLQHLFTANLVFALFFGLSCAVFPAWVFQLYGLTGDPGGLWVARLVGGSILGFATLMWFGRKAAITEARRAIALALLVQDAIGLLASLDFQLTGEVNAFGWASLALYGFLTIGYAYFLYVRRKDS